jgi:hypothetical protein
LHNQRSQHRESDKDEYAYLKFQTAFVPIHFEALLSILATFSQGAAISKIALFLLGG